METRFALAPVAEETESSTKATRTAETRSGLALAVGPKKSTKLIPIQKETTGETLRRRSRLSTIPWARKIDLLPIRGSSARPDPLPGNITDINAATGVSFLKRPHVDERSIILPKADWWPGRNSPSPLATAISQRDFNAIRKAFLLGANPRERYGWPCFAKLKSEYHDPRRTGELDPIGLAVIHLHWLAPKTDPGIVCDMTDLLLEFVAGRMSWSSEFEELSISITTAMILDSSGKVVQHLVRKASNSMAIHNKHELFYYACQAMNQYAIAELYEQGWNTSQRVWPYDKLLHTVAGCTSPRPLGSARAEYQRFKQVAELLVSHNEDINALNNNNVSPISIAITSLFLHNCPLRVAWFLEQGASTRTDTYGRTVFDLLIQAAKQTNKTRKKKKMFKEVYNILIQAGIPSPSESRLTTYRNWVR